ncbi:MAG: PspC domain-containing protein [Clostridiales bacterium]|nr:PspC domain-containing protein [Clostridiales bacterium]
MKRRLKRSNENRLLAGVCGGIGEYFGIDPTIVRVLTVIAALFCFGTVIVLLYIILIFVIPPDDGIIDV